MHSERRLFWPGPGRRAFLPQKNIPVPQRPSGPARAHAYKKRRAPWPGPGRRAFLPQKNIPAPQHSFWQPVRTHKRRRGISPVTGPEAVPAKERLPAQRLSISFCGRRGRRGFVRQNTRAQQANSPLPEAGSKPFFAAAHTNSAVQRRMCFCPRGPGCKKRKSPHGKPDGCHGGLTVYCAETAGQIVHFPARPQGDALGLFFFTRFPTAALWRASGAGRPQSAR